MTDGKFIYGKNINTGENYGHIGDKYEGIKQRIFTKEDLTKLVNEINEFSQKYSDKINTNHLTIGNPGDKESNIYCQQIFNALTQNGYKVEVMGLMTNGFVDKNISVSNAPDDTILIEVFQAPNV
tara:strand:+ start:356 stop:730 length:375 start_codon:yes stop_codon:yes gene_type:complete